MTGSELCARVAARSSLSKSRYSTEYTELPTTNFNMNSFALVQFDSHRSLFRLRSKNSKPQPFTSLRTVGSSAHDHQPEEHKNNVATSEYAETLT